MKMSPRWAFYTFAIVVVALLVIVEDVRALFKVEECTPIYTTKVTPCRQKIRKWYVAVSSIVWICTDIISKLAKIPYSDEVVSFSRDQSLQNTNMHVGARNRTGPGCDGPKGEELGDGGCQCDQVREL
jgi:hypothetical protein